MYIGPGDNGGMRNNVNQVMELGKQVPSLISLKIA